MSTSIQTRHVWVVSCDWCHKNGPDDNKRPDGWLLLNIGDFCCPEHEEAYSTRRWQERLGYDWDVAIRRANPALPPFDHWHYLESKKVGSMEAEVKIRHYFMEGRRLELLKGDQFKPYFEDFEKGHGGRSADSLGFLDWMISNEPAFMAHEAMLIK